jgi:hypothetical protein
VILGTKSYDRQIRDERRNFLQGMVSLTRPTLFDGCSADGLNDPDFARLQNWLEVWDDFLSASLLAYFPIAYGAYEKLPRFLRNLAPAKVAPPHPTIEAGFGTSLPLDVSIVRDGTESAAAAVDRQPRRQDLARDGGLVG